MFCLSDFSLHLPRLILAISYSLHAIVDFFGEDSVCLIDNGVLTFVIDVPDQMPFFRRPVDHACAGGGKQIHSVRPQE